MKEYRPPRSFIIQRRRLEERSARHREVRVQGLPGCDYGDEWGCVERIGRLVTSLCSGCRTVGGAAVAAPANEDGLNQIARLFDGKVYLLEQQCITARVLK